MTKFKWVVGQTYRTVNGCEAKLVARLNHDKFPLLFVVTKTDGSQEPVRRNYQGFLTSLDPTYQYNVVPPEPDKTSKFVNVYQDAVGANFNTYDSARLFEAPDTKGILEIQFEDGEYSGTVFHPANKGEDK